MKKLGVIILLAALPFGGYAQKIAGGLAHSLVVCSDNTLNIWGDNFFGILGLGDSIDRYTPVPYSGISDVKSVACGEWLSLALKNDGSAWVCGLGTVQYPNPTKVSGTSVFTAMVSSTNHSLLLKNDSTVWAWGTNLHGQLGTGDQSTHLSIVQVSGLGGVVSIAAGSDFSLALKKDGTIWTWGKNHKGQLGIGDTTDRYSPVMINSLTGVLAISAGLDNARALTSDSTVWEWGWGYHALCSDTNLPVIVAGLSNVVQIASGHEHFLALKSDSTVWAWGSNFYGQLGNGNNSNQYPPVQVNGISGIIYISAGSCHTLALETNGSLWCWGRNNHGQLGNGTTNDSNIPAEVNGVCYISSELAEAPIAEDNFKLFPNPATTHITLQLPPQYEQATTIEVFDRIGQLVLRMGYSAEVDVSALPAGLYFLVVSNEDGERVTGKLIKE